MSDKQNHKDPLERFFQKKAEEYDISYREEDWLKLEKELDARDMKIYYRRRFGWLVAASILIFSLIGYYTVQNHNKINELTEQLNQSEGVQQYDESLSNQTEEELSENNSGEQSEEAQISSEDQEILQIPTKNDFSEQSQQDRIDQNQSEMIAAISEDKVSSTESRNGSLRTFSETGQSIRHRTVQPKELFPNRLSMRANVRSGNQLTPVERIERDLNSVSPFIHEDSDKSSIASRRGPISGQHGYEASPNNKTIGSRFAIGIVVSPDLSTAGGVSNFDDPGYKGGVMAEFAINNRFSVISGLAISNVKYKADGRAYDPPGAWNYGVLPDRTRAVCLVLDIPVNLKASLFNFDRSRIFTTAGLSSYIMMNEDYQFGYDSNQPGLESSWSDATGTRHWFSNAGFSIGFEYDLNSEWSLRVEPHIKVPLKGVGWGDVELYSMGSFISLNYRFGTP